MCAHTFVSGTHACWFVISVGTKIYKIICLKLQQKLAGVGSKFGRADCSQLCRYNLWESVKWNAYIYHHYKSAFLALVSRFGHVLQWCLTENGVAKWSACRGHTFFLSTLWLASLQQVKVVEDLHLLLAIGGICLGLRHNTALKLFQICQTKTRD